MSTYAISAATIRAQISTEITSHQRASADRFISRYNRELELYRSVDTLIHVSEPVAYAVAEAYERRGWKVSLRLAPKTRSVYHLNISLI